MSSYDNDYRGDLADEAAADEAATFDNDSDQNVIARPSDTTDDPSYAGGQLGVGSAVRACDDSDNRIGVVIRVDESEDGPVYRVAWYEPDRLDAIPADQLKSA